MVQMPIYVTEAFGVSVSYMNTPHVSLLFFFVLCHKGGEEEK